MKPFSSNMKAIITKILTKHGQITKFSESDEFHYRIEREHYLPLVIERHSNKVIVTHYREENGDLIPDPDMEFMIGADGEWYPVALQLWNGSYYRARWTEGGKEYINPRQIREQLSFARMWASNLKAQGW